MKLDVFIQGETIDLCIPTLEFAQQSDWYKWFNDPYVTPFLEHGVFPNTREKQIEFFQREKDRRLLLIVSNKDGYPIGSTSLMNIDYRSQSAGSGLVIGNFVGKNPLEALEAIARLTEHAFLKIGLKRIVAGQHVKLIPWSHRMSLLGYRLEGIEKNSFVKGIERSDVLKIACHYEDYQKIISSRNGRIWDSQEKMLNRIKNLPKIPIHKKLQEFFETSDSYYQGIFSL